MAKKTMDQAVRAYCLQCSNHSKKEVETCPIKKCPLYPYRLGKEEQGQVDNHQHGEDRTEVESSPQLTLFD
ncbi:MAG: hypothetical protein ABRQ23_01575 [Syntrophomonadaceae bacterium]